MNSLPGSMSEAGSSLAVLLQSQSYAAAALGNLSLSGSDRVINETNLAALTRLMLAPLDSAGASQGSPGSHTVVLSEEILHLKLSAAVAAAGALQNFTSACDEPMDDRTNGCAKEIADDDGGRLSFLVSTVVLDCIVAFISGAEGLHKVCKSLMTYEEHQDRLI